MKKNISFIILLALLSNNCFANVLLTASKRIFSSTSTRINRQFLIKQFNNYQKRHFADPASVSFGALYVIGYTPWGAPIIATALTLTWVGSGLYILWKICTEDECTLQYQDTGRRRVDSRNLAHRRNEYYSKLYQKYQQSSKQTNQNQNNQQNSNKNNHDDKDKRNKRPDFKDKKIEAVEFMNACKTDKKNYRWDNKQKILIANKNNRPIFEGKEVGAYAEDKLHGEIEIYDKNGDWFAAMDPSTGKRIPKPAGHGYGRRVKLT